MLYFIFAPPQGCISYWKNPTKRLSIIILWTCPFKSKQGYLVTFYRISHKRISIHRSTNLKYIHRDSLIVYSVKRKQVSLFCYQQCFTSHIPLPPSTFKSSSVSLIKKKQLYWSLSRLYTINKNYKRSMS